MEQTILPFMPSANIWSITSVSDARRTSSYCSLSDRSNLYVNSTLKLQDKRGALLGRLVPPLFLSASMFHIFMNRKRNSRQVDCP